MGKNRKKDKQFQKLIPWKISIKYDSYDSDKGKEQKPKVNVTKTGNEMLSRHREINIIIKKYQRQLVGYWWKWEYFSKISLAQQLFSNFYHFTISITFFFLYTVTSLPVFSLHRGSFWFFWLSLGLGRAFLSSSWNSIRVDCIYSCYLLTY